MSHRPVPPESPDRAAGATVRSELLRLSTLARISTQARRQRNELMTYAFERGITIRQLGELVGVRSTSTVADIVRHGVRGAILDDPAPMEDGAARPSASPDAEDPFSVDCPRSYCRQPSPQLCRDRFGNVLGHPHEERAELAADQAVFGA